MKNPRQGSVPYNYIAGVLAVVTLLGIAEIIYAFDTKWIAVGSLHNWYANAGCEIELGRTGETPTQLDGMRWPAQYRFRDMQAGKGLWIGVTNYYDPHRDKTYNYKVVHAGPRVVHEKSEFIPQEFTMVGKFPHPGVVVDGVPATDMQYMDIVDEIDQSLNADRMLVTRVNTALGISATRRIYAFSQQNHDNYFIHDYVLKNTGIIDSEGGTHNQTLEGVVFFFQFRWAVCREGTVYDTDHTWLAQSAVWGKNTMNDVTGEDPASGELRALISWHGRHSEEKGYDNIGAPFFEDEDGNPGDGHLGGSAFIGMATIHADKLANDKADDPYQPTTTYYLESNELMTRVSDEFNEAMMTEQYTAMTAGHPVKSHAEAVGNGDADKFMGTGGGFSQTAGYGPYTMAPGDSIHIVWVEAVAGISRELDYSIGDEWLNGTPPFDLPDGTTTDDKNEFKNAWVYTSRDSLVQTFQRAINAYNDGLYVPPPPPPPSDFAVSSGGDRITLTWNNNAESWPNFAGYRIYRAIHFADSTYYPLYECGQGTDNPLVNEYPDLTAKRGFDYYYYIVSFDDGSTNDVSPGTPLASSRFYTMTNEPAYLRRTAGRRMDDIRIVPNPYNIKARDLQYGISAPNRIMFLNIPAFCTIKIYTERGDLIMTLRHADGSGDEAWDLITSYRQLVVSGVYIAYIEVTQDYTDPITGELLYRSGESAIEKFVVVR